MVSPVPALHSLSTAGAAMSGFRLGARSRRNLIGVHPDLVAVVARAIEMTEVDFVVLEGVRTLERQQALVAAGASRTLKSRHLTGHAVDLGAIVDGAVTWRTESYVSLSRFVFAAAKAAKIPVEWGGSWPGFRDYPHWQLPREGYP